MVVQPWVKRISIEKKKKDFRNDKGMLEFRRIVCIDEIIFDIRVFLKNDVQQKIYA